MPRFLVHRTVGDMSDAEIDAAGRRSNGVLTGMPGVRWIRSYYSAEEGKIYCEYEAPDLDTLFEHAKRAKLPFDGGHVVRELRPEMFV